MPDDFCPNCVTLTLRGGSCRCCGSVFKIGELMKSYAQRRLVKAMLPSLKEALPRHIPLGLRDGKAKPVFGGCRLRLKFRRSLEG